MTMMPPCETTTATIKDEGASSSDAAANTPPEKNQTAHQNEENVSDSGEEDSTATSLSVPTFQSDVDGEDSLSEVAVGDDISGEEEHDHKDSEDDTDDDEEDDEEEESMPDGDTNADLHALLAFSKNRLVQIEEQKSKAPPSPEKEEISNENNDDDDVSDICEDAEQEGEVPVEPSTPNSEPTNESENGTEALTTEPPLEDEPLEPVSIHDNDSSPSNNVDSPPVPLSTSPPSDNDENKDNNGDRDNDSDGDNDTNQTSVPQRRRLGHNAELWALLSYSKARLETGKTPTAEIMGGQAGSLPVDKKKTYEKKKSERKKKASAAVASLKNSAASMLHKRDKPQTFEQNDDFAIDSDGDDESVNSCESGFVGGESNGKNMNTFGFDDDEYDHDHDDDHDYSDDESYDSDDTESDEEEQEQDHRFLNIINDHEDAALGDVARSYGAAMLAEAETTEQRLQLTEGTMVGNTPGVVLDQRRPSQSSSMPTENNVGRRISPTSRNNSEGNTNNSGRVGLRGWFGRGRENHNTTDQRTNNHIPNNGNRGNNSSDDDILSSNDVHQKTSHPTILIEEESSPTRRKPRTPTVKGWLSKDATKTFRRRNASSKERRGNNMAFLKRMGQSLKEFKETVDIIDHMKTEEAKNQINLFD
mmetsp:Transcript_59983/g.89083  ORF Transcript_59983/g.89083 Transcript_59983/m.89083 type:complete len:646 (-) Transcript_59983:366-2303(-)